MQMMPSRVIPFSSAQAHYDQLLTEHYDWMFGMSLEVKVIESHNITIQQADIRNLNEYVAPATASLVVCMGDTLTHLSNRQEVVALLQSVALALKPRGLFVATYRDLSGPELEGLDRFIPVRGDDGRAMICFLEYRSSEIVLVNDLIYVRDGAGRWAC